MPSKTSRPSCPRAGLRTALALAISAATVLTVACGGGGGGGGGGTTVTDNNPGNTSPPTYDVAKLGVPKFVNSIYIDLSQKNPDGSPVVNQISKFRSSQGHDYSDSYESCLSMKHYLSTPDSNTKIYVPVTGTVTWQDTPIVGPNFSVQSDLQPAFVFTVMHVVPLKSYKMGDHVTEGDLLGHHVGTWTSSDIIVDVNDGGPKASLDGYGPGGRLVSYFQTLTDAAFQPFKARGINSPTDLIISKAQRDSFPITCVAGAFVFTVPDPLPGFLKF